MLLLARKRKSCLSVYERTTGVPGPLFSERALTLGLGQFNLSVGYAYVDFNELNGTNLDNLRSRGLIFETDSPVPSAVPGRFQASVVASQLRTQIDLQAHLFVPALRYGITDNWDVGLSVPVVNTFLRVKNTAVPVAEVDPSDNVYLFTSSGSPLGLLNPPETTPFRQTRRSPRFINREVGSATGIGDVTLRTKYQLWRTQAADAAVGLNVQLPTGEGRDFQGTDETHLSPFLYVSQVFLDRFEPHLNAGVDLNVNEAARSSFVWAAGMTVLVWNQLGLGIDFIGRSEFEGISGRSETFAGINFDREVSTCSATSPCFLRQKAAFPRFPIKLKRNDIIDFSSTLRYGLGQRGSIFFGMIMPMNSDGFRADFIPAGGVELLF